jgi:hypothetical protein
MSIAADNGGFIVIARKIFDNPLLKDAERFRAWAWLLGEAAWKQRRIRIATGRTSRLIVLERGQLSHSLRYMATSWGWSIKRVRTFLDDLEADEMIVRGTGHAKGTQTTSQTTTQTGIQTGTDQNIITICNYCTYQDLVPDEGTQTGHSNGHANGHAIPRKWAQRRTTNQ